MQESMTAPEPKVTKTQQMATAGSDAKDTKKGLSMQQQYVRIMQNQGYFAPWSRTNNWNDRLAINNIRKHNTPEVGFVFRFVPICCVSSACLLGISTACLC